MATAPKFRIDVEIHNLLMNTAQTPAKPALVMGRNYRTRWGNIDQHKFGDGQLTAIKKLVNSTAFRR